MRLRRDDVDTHVVGAPMRGLLSALRTFRSIAAAHHPDWLVACSDAWTAPICRVVAQELGARLAIDAYDDFESYMPWNAPLHWLYRRALREADLVTAAGPQLAALLDRQRHGKRPTDILEMAADPPFQPLDRSECRRALGLPEHRPLIGYSGGWAANRGTSMLIELFRRLSARHPGIGIALTGRPPSNVLSVPGVVGLGYLPDEALPKFVNAMDVSLVVTAPTRFGRSSYPAKLYEAMACQVPVVATATDPVRWILRRNPECLVEPGDPEAFAARIDAMLTRGRIDYGPRPTWDDAGTQLARLLEEIGPKNLAG
jgi:glycosyltransferase involved in cell wall biosynthesis